MRDTGDTARARPWQVFVVCFVVFLLIDVLRQASKGPLQLGPFEIIGPAVTAAVFTGLWWFFWGRLRG